MPRVSAIRRLLSSLRDPVTERALLAALPTADREAVRWIARTLLDRQTPAGLLGLVLNYHLLDEPTQHLLATQARLFTRPLREASGLRSTQGPRNAIRMIRRSLDASQAYLLVEHLRHGTPELRELAGECLEHLCHAATPAREGGPPPVLDAAAAEFLRDTLDDAVAALSHHACGSTLSALLWMSPRPLSAKLAAQFSHAKDAATAALQGLLRSPETTPMRRSLLVMLPIAPLCEAVLDGLRHVCRAGMLGESLEMAHLLKLAPMRTALAGVATPESLYPDTQQVASMRPHQRRGLPAYAAALPVDGPVLVAKLARLGAQPDEATRLLALRWLIELATTTRPFGVDEAIVAFCDDASEDIARLAVHHMIRMGGADLPKLLGRLVASPHEAVRRIASAKLAPAGFAKLWEAWPRLDANQRLAAGRALIKINPSIHRMLADRLAMPHRPTRLRALNIIVELNQAAFFETALVRLAAEADSHIASAAVRALGGAAGTEAQAALRSALRQSDGRIRANAVEAMAQQDLAQAATHVAPLVRDDVARPRANAVLALLHAQPQIGREALVKMLGDARPGHRLSAVWVVEAASMLDLSPRVAEMSISDPDVAVRARAERCVKRLLEVLARPAEPAASLQEATS